MLNIGPVEEVKIPLHNNEYAIRAAFEDHSENPLGDTPEVVRPNQHSCCRSEVTDLLSRAAPLSHVHTARFPITLLPCNSIFFFIDWASSSRLRRAAHGRLKASARLGIRIRL